jgi:glucosylceramidase
MIKKTIFAGVLLAMSACSTQPVKDEKETLAPSTFAIEGKQVKVYTTADSSDMRLTPEPPLSFAPFNQPRETQPFIYVDPAHSFQTFIGIGGALTDASAETFSKLPADKQDEVLKAYYDKETGIGYTWGRTNINSCDFSSDMYTYVADGDKELKTFNIDHDRKFKIPLIKKVIAAAGGKLDLFVSPWSPPAWMKDNNDMLHGGKLKEEFAEAWANYYIKFIQEYEKEGIPIWGLTVQNEPMAKQTWESCMYSAQDERDFIKNHLGPALEKNGMTGKKLVAWDHNRDLLDQRASTLLNDPDAAKYIWGIGFHWYENWNGGWQFGNVKKVNESFPDKKLLLTEGCNGPYSEKELSNWKWGEIYGENMINDFNNGAVAWTDWNILLDEKGGPNHVQNYCYAPVHADNRNGSVRYMNSYYYIGHFSKFIHAGAKRILSSSNRAQLLTTAFQNEDGSLVVVVMNKTHQKFPYRMYVGEKAVEATSPAHSIQTLVIQ